MPAPQGISRTSHIASGPDEGLGFNGGLKDVGTGIQADCFTKSFSGELQLSAQGLGQ